MPSTHNLHWRQTVPLLVSVLLVSGGCVAATGPVEAVRFVSADRAAELGHGMISIAPAQMMEADSLEYRTYAAAVADQLQRIGYRFPLPGETPGPNASHAMIGFERSVKSAISRQGPVSVGVGGSTGGFGSGVGLGVGLNLGGKPKDQVVTELRAVIRASDDTVLWEGRASVEAKAGSPMADSALNAAKLAEGLFQGFPGESGATIRVP